MNTTTPQPDLLKAGETGAAESGAKATGSQATGAAATGASATGAKETGAKATGSQTTGAKATGSQTTGAKKKAKPAPDEPVHLVLQTSRLHGEDGRPIARGRVVLTSADAAGGLVTKGWAREATEAEIRSAPFGVATLA